MLTALLSLFLLIQVNAQEDDLPVLEGDGFNSFSALSLKLHEENYVLPYYHTSPKPLGAHQSTDLKYQFSLKLSLIGNGHQSLSFAYTQKSFWQAYDAKNSRPFRETNYNPEVFLRLGSRVLFFDIGYEHESNGNEDPISRSWDRAYLSFHLQLPRFKLQLKSWAILAEEKSGPDYEERPEAIKTYMGYNELTFGFWMGNVILKTSARMNFGSNKGRIENSLLIPLGRQLFLASVYTHGYADELRNYNRNVETYGIGLLINP
jgi:phospholipase A1